jgi:hypothetical protein
MIPSTSESGVDGVPCEHARSRTSVSLAPSETATLSTGSKFARTNKATLLESSGSRVPNVTVPELPTKHKGRTLVLCFDGTGDQYVFGCWSCFLFFDEHFDRFDDDVSYVP